MMNAPTDIGTIADWTPERIIADIESLVRREGHRQYSSQLDEGVYLSQLCGVSAHLVRKSGIVRLFTHDMDIVLSPSGDMVFARGTLMLLRAHHRNLCAYRRAMCATLMPTPNPVSEQAA